MNHLGCNNKPCQMESLINFCRHIIAVFFDSQMTRSHAKPPIEIDQ